MLCRRHASSRNPSKYLKALKRNDDLDIPTTISLKLEDYEDFNLCLNLRRGTLLHVINKWDYEVSSVFLGKSLFAKISQIAPESFSFLLFHVSFQVNLPFCALSGRVGLPTFLL